MEYTNSPLVSYTKLSPNHSGQRTHSIDRITPHCVVGQCSVETLGNIFAPSSRQASSNYGIGVDGRVAMYVEEKNRSWCSSSKANDQRAVTIECASDTAEPYAMNGKVYASLLNLCIDICSRNGKKKLLWFADKDKSLNYEPADDEMILSVHRWFDNRSCPGQWLYDRLGDLAEQVTFQLNGSTIPVNDGKKQYSVRVGEFSDKANAEKLMNELKARGYDAVIVDGENQPVDTALPYRVRITAKQLNVRKLPTTSSAIITSVKLNEVYTIVEESNGWGKLKSGAGWICLDYVTTL